jgi:hypothetical protein
MEEAPIPQGLPDLYGRIRIYHLFYFIFYLFILFTQPLTEMITETGRKFLGVERGRQLRMTTSLPSESQLRRQCEILNI